MPQIEPHDREWVAGAASALAGLISAIRRVDHPAVAEQVAALLNAATRYVNATQAERPDDAALRAAVERLGAASRQP